MQISLVRIDDEGRYTTRIQRDDRVRFCIQGVGHGFEVPHDLAHFAVERALGLHTGFWGTVAGGGVFPSMTYEGGRRKPKAAERSKAILKANVRRLIEAEIAVNVFGTAISEGHPRTSIVLRGRLRERLPTLERKITALQIADVYSGFRQAADHWKVLRVGEAMHVTWSSR